MTTELRTLVAHSLACVQADAERQARHADLVAKHHSFADPAPVRSVAMLSEKGRDLAVDIDTYQRAGGRELRPAE